MRIVGIDLGTTNSLVAYYDENGAHIIPNRLGEPLTPSCVSLNEDGEIFVGKIAKERLISHPTMSTSNFKRYMGSYKKIPIGDKEFLPEELSSFVIKSLVEDAEIFLGEKIDEAIISVPAYFSDVQRKATQRAGELAGIKVERLINEPTAAAIAYGIKEKSENTKYMVIDLGGGTFDVSMLEMFNGIMEVRGVAGDNFLGGEDFTDALVSLFLDKASIDLNSLTLKNYAIIKRQAELSKLTTGSGDINIKCNVMDNEFDVYITDEEYENECKELLQRLRKPIERVLNDTSIKIADIDSIVLVGGATKLSYIKKFIGKLFRKFPSTSINPDEVVAMGAALQAAMKERNENIKEIVLIDVCPYTLGTNVSVTRENGRIESGHFLPIIERNTVIPVSKTERLYTLHDNQKTIRVEILQGESRFSINNVLLGELNVNVPVGPAGKEAIDIRYTYDINGILEVIVTVVSTSIKKTMIIEQNPGYMTKDEVEQRLKDLEAIKIHPRDQEEYKFLLAKGERIYEESVGDVRRLVESCIQEFEDALDKQDNLIARDAAKQFKEQLENFENYY